MKIKTMKPSERLIKLIDSIQSPYLGEHVGHTVREIIIILDEMDERLKKLEEDTEITVGGLPEVRLMPESGKKPCWIDTSGVYKKPEKQEPKERWTPKHEEEYYFIGTSGEIGQTIHYKDIPVDRMRAEFGNCFPYTKEGKKQTQEASKKVKELLLNLHK